MNCSVILRATPVSADVEIHFTLFSYFPVSIPCRHNLEISISCLNKFFLTIAWVSSTLRKMRHMRTEDCSSTVGCLLKAALKMKPLFGKFHPLYSMGRLHKTYPVPSIPFQ